MSAARIAAAVAALRAGRPVLVADDEGRENEGDVILAAATATAAWVAWTVRHTSGFLCAPMPADVADRLALPLMVPDGQDPRGTAYTISVDAAEGVTTGISAADRARTLRVLADPGSGPTDLIRPGHIIPLRAVDGGVSRRAGHTEAAVDLLRLAGLPPVAAIAEVVRDDGAMMRYPELVELGADNDLPVLTIAELVAAGGEPATPASPGQPVAAPRDALVEFQVSTSVPTRFGTFELRAYRDLHTGADHVAVVSGSPRDGALVRLHSECLTGEALGSEKCECGPQLDAALATIAAEGGVVVYLRGHEGRGIGLVNKLRAYRLQEDGLDTLDANLALGLPADAREYGAAAEILADLGLASVRLLTNNPGKRDALERGGVAVSERVPLVVGVGEANRGYLEAKRDRMGHLLAVTDVGDLPATPTNDGGTP